MADLSIAAASVLPGTNARIENGFAGETIAAGAPVYKASTGLWMNADCNSGTALARAAKGSAANSASANQPIAVQKSGQQVAGATLTPGLAYYLSATAGKVCPVGDLTTGMYPQVIAIALSATVWDLVFKDAGVAL